MSMPAWPHLLVRVMDVHGRLGLVTPDVLVEGLQEWSLQQGQGAPHLAAALPQPLMAASRVAEAQRT